MATVLDVPPVEAAAPPLRHRRRWIAAACALVLLAGGGTFAGLWIGNGAHQVPISVAQHRFHPGNTGTVKGPDPLRPAQGVYAYTGSGTEHVSFPSKTQYEGPTIPGTVIYKAQDCWSFRLDFSSNHWQSYTYCPKPKGVNLTSRSGWYRWDFVVTVVADTSTYSCRPTEIAIPATLIVGQHHTFSCRGTNNHLAIPPVIMSGYGEYLGTSTVVVQGKGLQAVHIREVASFSGGQTGSNVADTWYETGTYLPLKGTWSTEVHTASPVGMSTMTASGRFGLSALTPAS